jgi:hypothetical protein
VVTTPAPRKGCGGKGKQDGCGHAAGILKGLSGAMDAFVTRAGRLANPVPAV